jgi:hypothetical protein
MRPYYADWTVRIDNSTLTPHETLDAVAAAVGEGSARIA